MSNGQNRCALCGEPMPPGEEMFQYHGNSGPCPKPHLPQDPPTVTVDRQEWERMKRESEALQAIFKVRSTEHGGGFRRTLDELNNQIGRLFKKEFTPSNAVEPQTTQ